MIEQFFTQPKVLSRLWEGVFVADRKSDNKKVSFDRAILFELFVIPL